MFKTYTRAKVVNQIAKGILVDSINFVRIQISETTKTVYIVSPSTILIYCRFLIWASVVAKHTFV